MPNFFNIYKVLFRYFRDGVKNYFKNWRNNFKKLVTTHLKEKIIVIILALFTFAYVRFQDVEQRNLFVPLQINKIDELTFVNDLPETVSLFVSGNRSALNNLDVNKIVARIDLTDVTFPGTIQRSPILESIPEGIQILRINPQTLEIELSNLEKKLLRIEATLVGRPRSDFQIRNVQVSPGRLWVLGPKDILNDLTKIETEPIDINALDQSKQISVSFNKNIHPGLKFDRDRQLEVLISVESEYVMQTLVEPVEVTYEMGEEWSLLEPLWVSNISYEIYKDNLVDFNIDQDLIFYFETEGIDEPGEHTVQILLKKNKKIRKVSFIPSTAVVQVIDGSDDSLFSTEDE